jgi:hypothetical protein
MMKTYGRNKQIVSDPAAQSPAPQTNERPKEGEKKGVRINGFQQVIDLLRAADPEFRVSLLRRIIVQDPHLGKSIQADLSRYL